MRVLWAVLNVHVSDPSLFAYDVIQADFRRKSGQSHVKKSNFQIEVKRKRHMFLVPIFLRNSSMTLPFVYDFLLFFLTCFLELREVRL